MHTRAVHPAHSPHIFYVSGFDAGSLTVSPAVRAETCSPGIAPAASSGGCKLETVRWRLMGLGLCMARLAGHYAMPLCASSSASGNTPLPVHQSF